MRDIRLLFPTDDPVPPDLLIGRADDVTAVVRRLEAGTHVVLAGPRRTGKTTVAYAALRRIREAGSYAAAVDLFAHDDLASLAEALAQAILSNRGPIARAIERTRAAGRGMRDLMGLSVIAKLQAELGSDIEIALRPGGARDDPNCAFVGALTLAQRIALADDRRMVLFIDEFQDIAGDQRRFGDPDTLTKQMRAVLQRSPQTTVMFAGSIEHLMRDLFGPKDRALSQFGTFQPLSPITDDEWMRGIADRYRRLGVTVASESALERLVSLGDGHPRATMLIARETLTVALTAHDERHVQLADVDAGLALALEADRLRHDQLVERMRFTKGAHEIAVRIARGERPYPGRAPATVQRALRTLELQGVIEQPRRGSWVVGDPLLRGYLASIRRRPEAR